MLRLRFKACMVLFLICLVHADEHLWNSILEKRVESEFCSNYSSYWLQNWNLCYKTPNKYNGGDYRKETIASPTEVPIDSVYLFSSPIGLCLAFNTYISSRFFFLVIYDYLIFFCYYAFLACSYLYESMLY